MPNGERAAVESLEAFLSAHFQKRARELMPSAEALRRSVEYSLYSGGKRFRPLVAFLTAELLGVDFNRVTPHAAAVELVHTYSLIHDDLPAMDDDMYRRGVYTNHILFGEDTALLAGDALLTEAFYVIGESYKDIPELGLELTRLLAEAAGFSGMVAGQVADLHMARGSFDVSAEDLLRMHERKTGALIRYASEGVAVLARRPQAEQTLIREFGAKLGLAFQIADDLLDFDPERPEKNGLPYILGEKKTRELLNSVSQDCETILLKFNGRASQLVGLVKKNMNRRH